MATEDAAPLATASAALASSASSSVTVQSLREQLARQSYAFVCAHDMWHMLGVAADTAPSLLALWASMVKVALLVVAHAATCRPRSPPPAQRERERQREESPRRLAAEESLQRRSAACPEPHRAALACHLGGTRPCLRLTRRVARSTRSRAPSSRTTTSMPPPAMGLAAHRGTARWSAALALAHCPRPMP